MLSSVGFLTAAGGVCHGLVSRLWCRWFILNKLLSQKKKTVKHVKLASTTHFCPIPRTVFGVPPLADRLTGYPAGRCARILPPRVNSRRFLIPRKSAVPVIWMTHVVSPVIFSPSTLPLSPSSARSLPESQPLVSRSTAPSIVPSHRPSRPTPRPLCCHLACRTAVVHLQKRSACACCWCCHEVPPMHSVPSACNRIESSAVAAAVFVCIRNTSVARSERKGGNSDPKLSVALRCQNSTQTQP